MPPQLAVDVAIIGAGPTGLFAAYYAGFRGFSTALVDSLEVPGGQIAAMYPEKPIFDVAGFPSVRGQQLVDNLVEQAAPFEPAYLLGCRAENLTAEPRHAEAAASADSVSWRISTSRQLDVVAKAVIVTGGIGTFQPRPLPQAEQFVGRGLRYFVPQLAELAGHDVLVVGGGDSAVDWALALLPVAASVTLVHRRDRFRAHEASVRRMLASDVDVRVWTEVAEIVPDEAGHVGGVILTHNKTRERSELAVTAIVAALGFTADLGPLAGWGIATDKRHIPVDTTMATNLRGVFAAGDICDYPGKVRLIATGFGEAATAVNNAAPVIDPALHVFGGHSSDQGDAGATVVVDDTSREPGSAVPTARVGAPVPHRAARPLVAAPEPA